MTEKPSHAYVKAKVQLQEGAQPISIERYVSDYENLICPENEKSSLQMKSRLADQGLHMLTRRQMLRFITVSPAKRAEQIQALLNLDKIEVTRKCLVSINRILKRNYDEAKINLEASQSDVREIFGLDLYDSNDVLQAVNECRERLRANPLQNISTETLRSGIGYNPVSEDVTMRPSLLVEHTNNLLRLGSEPELGKVVKLERKLAEKLDQFHSDPVLLRSLTQQQLLELGLDLVNDDFCPLCDRQWNQADLKTHLARKIAKASSASQLLAEVERLEGDLRAPINAVISNLEQILSPNVSIAETQLVELRNWERKLKRLRSALQNSLSNYTLDGTSAYKIETLFSTEFPRDTLQSIALTFERLEESYSSEASPEADAYAKLAKAVTMLDRLRKCAETYKSSCKSFRRSVSLNKHFTESRDQILGELYESISDEFTRLYRELHQDEDSFCSQISPQDAGLKLNVDFYGRGLVPPNALHSDGHQDSMGLCLFLVLSEKLSGSDLQIMLLDDVVMSVDAGHRKPLARLLVREFQNRQIIVATCERTWLEQLRAEGFVTKPNILELTTWNIVDGTKAKHVKDVWEKISRDLSENDTSAAALQLRRWAEAFFCEVCHSFQARVTFKIDQRWTLEDCLDSAQHEVKRLLKQAKSVAQNDGNHRRMDCIQRVDDKRVAAYRNLGKERWAVNVAVHYNQWDTLLPEELKDVVDAFRQFHDLLHCSKCGKLLGVSSNKEFLECGCGHIHWKL